MKPAGYIVGAAGLLGLTYLSGAFARGMSVMGVGPRVPVDAPFLVTSRYGGRPDPFGRDTAVHQHSGIDLVPVTVSGALGAPVYAAEAGTLIRWGTWDGLPALSTRTPNGNYLAIRDAAGYVWYYLHLHSVQLGNIGAKVERGTPIGTVGETGRATGPHLHLQVYNPGGQIVDPESMWPGGRILA